MPATPTRAPMISPTQAEPVETEAGATLLERSGRGIRATPAGVLLAEHASRILDQVDDAERALAALRSGAAGRLSIAAFPTAGSSLVPVAVGRFRQACPGVELDLGVAEAEAATDLLQRGSIDLAVALEPFDRHSTPADGLVRRHLMDDPFRLVLPKGHQLAHRRRIELGQVSDEPWVAATCCLGSCERTVLDACERAGFAPRFAVEADDYPAAQGYVGVGLGIAMIPMLALGAVRDDVVVRRIKGSEPVRHVYAVTRTPAVDGPLAVMVEALRSAAVEQVRAVQASGR